MMAQKQPIGLSNKHRERPTILTHTINNKHDQHRHQQQQQQQANIYKTFYLFSKNGQSIKQASLEAKKRPNLAKSKVCVISIICRDKLNESTRNELVQSLLGPIYIKQLDQAIRDEEDSSEDCLDDLSSNHDSPSRTATPDLDVSIYETQVVGNVDFDSNLVILTLNSILEADKLCQTIKPPGMTTNFLFSPDWPLRNQNLIKTLHIMLSVSHLVLFYNPDLSLDHNLIQSLKILEALRLKSQTRITDLLESIELTKCLPDRWVKQGRLCTPRALFVFGTNGCGANLKQSDIVSTKRKLEDQIYMTLKKLNIICQPDQRYSSIILPESDEFVLILNANDQVHTINKSFKASPFSVGPRNSLDSFYSGLMQSLGFEETTDNSIARTSRQKSISNLRPINTKHPSDNEPNQALARDGLRLKKFIQRHLSDMRSLSEQNGRQSNIVLPTYENLLAVLASLADLFFPVVEDELGLPSAFQSWRKPDERRFVDIYNLLNHEESFSRTYCNQIKETAYAMFLERLAASPARNQTDLSKLMQPIMQYYLIHARGSASLTYRDLLESSCTNRWQESRNKKSNRASKTKPFTVSRRPDEIILTSSCDCGQKSSYRLTTRDRKALDSVYISRLNRAENS